MRDEATRLPTWFFRSGQLLLLAYTLTRLFTDKPADYAGQLMVLMAAVAIAWFRHPLRYTFVTRLFFLAVLTQLVSWVMCLWLSPEIAESSPKVERLAAWFFLIPVAMFAPASPRGVFGLWGCGLAVLLLAPWLCGEGWQEIRNGLRGSRIEFGLVNSQHTGMLFGVAVLGLAAFLPRYWRFSASAGRRWTRPLYLLALLVTALFVIIAQTRAIWVALLLALLLTSLLFACVIGTQRRRSYLARLLALGWRTRLGLAAALLVLLVLGSGIVAQRVGDLSALQPDVQLQNADSTETESIRVRLYTWREAVDWIVQRPLFGWGGNGRGEVVRATPGLSKAEHERFRHLHNSYLGTLVNFGLAGLAIFVALLAYVTRCVREARRSGALDGDFFWFWLAFGCYWLVVNMFESYMYYQTGIYVFSLVAGGQLALTLRGSPGAYTAGPANRTQE
ncbi:O-antigen ligase family protein [Haliea sp. E17]|uniref:O-antigen ligase family protein n=1 Tax=Haliea sp. E17 TaxID=3401576 RepID=UPI003AABDDC7